MRKRSAILLLALFSATLIHPVVLSAMLLASGEGLESRLPACCRRLGVHRCYMMELLEEASHASGPGIGSIPDKCPNFPRPGTVVSHSQDLLLQGPSGFNVTWITIPATPVLSPLFYRSDSHRTCLDRGPPPSLSQIKTQQFDPGCAFEREDAWKVIDS